MVSVGFIGVGGIAQPHLENLDEIDDVSVTAVCDIDEDAAREAADPRDAAVYIDHERMYRESGDELDAVYVCLPPFAHTTQETMAAERGIHLLVEKPIALSMEKAREIEAAVDEHGVMAHVSYESRYDPIAERVGELTEGRRLALIDALVRSPVPSTAWWRVREKSGGQVVEMSTHHFDLIRCFAGEVERVAAYGNHGIRDEVDFEDATAAVMYHENGTVSHVSSTSVAPDWSSKGVHSIVGEDLRLDWEGGHLSGVVDGEEIDEETDADNHRREDRSFVEAIREDDPSYLKCPYADAVRSLELTLAVQEAIDTGEEVTL